MYWESFLEPAVANTRAFASRFQDPLPPESTSKFLDLRLRFFDMLLNRKLLLRISRLGFLGLQKLKLLLPDGQCGRWRNQNDFHTHRQGTLACEVLVLGITSQAQDGFVVGNGNFFLQRILLNFAAIQVGQWIFWLEFNCLSVIRQGARDIAFARTGVGPIGIN